MWAEMNRNDRTITDLTTGLDWPQHQMLKVLFERSGLKRNDWHQQAQQLVSRSLGSPTKLSDIFNGKSRSLPMRDIVPYIQALGMRKSETDYYIAEFFKAYCDENLHQYVQSRSKSQQILMLEQKLKVKEFEIKRLYRQMTYTKVYKKYFSEDKKAFEPIQNSSENLGSNECHACVDSYLNFFLDEGYVNYLDNSRFDIENLSIDAIDNIINRDNDKLIDKSLKDSEREQMEEDAYFSRLDECQHEMLEEELLSSYRQWYLMLTLVIEKNYDATFQSIASFVIPNSFDKQIIEHVENSSLHLMPSFRTIYEYVCSKISRFKIENKECFEQLLAIKKSEHQYRQNPKNSTFPGGEIKRREEIDTPIFLEDSKRKVEFENEIHTQVFSEYDFPFDMSFMVFDRPDIRRAIEAFFDDYFRFNELGLSFSISFDELCSLQNPPASPDKLSDQLKLKRLLSVIERKSEEICQDYGFDNPIKKIIEHPDYPNFFEGRLRRIAATPSWMDRFSNRTKTS